MKITQVAPENAKIRESAYNDASKSIEMYVEMKAPDAIKAHRFVMKIEQTTKMQASLFQLLVDSRVG